MICATIRPIGDRFVCSSYGSAGRTWTKLEKFQRDLLDSEMDAIASTMKTTRIPRRAFVVPGAGSTMSVYFNIEK